MLSVRAVGRPEWHAQSCEAHVRRERVVIKDEMSTSSRCVCPRDAARVPRVGSLTAACRHSRARSTDRGKVRSVSRRSAPHHARSHSTGVGRPTIRSLSEQPRLASAQRGSSDGQGAALTTALSRTKNGTAWRVRLREGNVREGFYSRLRKKLLAPQQPEVTPTTRGGDAYPTASPASSQGASVAGSPSSFDSSPMSSLASVVSSSPVAGA